MTLEDAMAPLSRVVAGYFYWRCRLTGHAFEPYTTVHVGDGFRQTFICKKCKKVRVESRRKDRRAR